MSRKFHLTPENVDTIVTSGTKKERIKIENGVVVKYYNIEGKWVKDDDTRNKSGDVG